MLSAFVAVVLSGLVVVKAMSRLPSLDHRVLLRRARRSAEQGFTMFEVLIALMISFLFLTGTLNAMVMATVMRVRAERQAQASFWIKEDLEVVRALAADYTDPDDDDACSDGIGQAFNADVIASLPDPGNRTILGRTVTLEREEDDDGGSVSTLLYTATDEEGNVLATLYTEVLPAAALDCTN